jgi:hypothetical protein
MTRAGGFFCHFAFSRAVILGMPAVGLGRSRRKEQFADGLLSAGTAGAEQNESRAPQYVRAHAGGWE